MALEVAQVTGTRHIVTATISSQARLESSGPDWSPVRHGEVDLAHLSGDLDSGDRSLSEADD